MSHDVSLGVIVVSRRPTTPTGTMLLLWQFSVEILHGFLYYKPLNYRSETDKHHLMHQGA
jgi:hypothetical protein